MCWENYHKRNMLTCLGKALRENLGIRKVWQSYPGPMFSNHVTKTLPYASEALISLHCYSWSLIFVHCLLLFEINKVMSCAQVKTYNGVWIESSWQNVCWSECVNSTTFNTLNDLIIWRKPTNDVAPW